MSDLTGVWAKLKQADSHIIQLEHEVVGYLQRNPYGVAIEDRPEMGKRVAVVLEITEPIPAVIPLVLGDAVHNLRSALDHLAYQAVPESSRENAAFPIPKAAEKPSPKKLEELLDRALKGADEAFRQAVRDTEPYPGGGVSSCGS